jgi:acetyl-CoA carboxylase biotin carboxyl carrier protein
MERSALNRVSGPLSEDEVRQIGRIIETLNQSKFDYLEIEIGELKLTISKGKLPEAVRATSSADAQSSERAIERPSAQPAAAKPVIETAKDENTATIVAPLVGRFYLQPKPGAPPFIVVGSEVSDDTTVGLIEVMKTFNAVHAGVSGTITEICVQDAALVEYGQVLFRVRTR